MDMRPKMGIICPAPLEFQTCCRVLKFVKQDEVQGRRIASKTTKEFSFAAIHSGPGKARCASATQLLIDRFGPHILIDTGAAGSLSGDVGIFDVVCAEKAYEHDICSLKDFSRFENDLTSRTLLNTLSQEEKSVLQQFKEHVSKEKSVHFFIGDIASGERNVSNKAFKEELRAHFQAAACNWETSAVLKTAELNNIDALSFRVITDFAEEAMPEELKKNWKKGLVILYDVLEEFLSGGWVSPLLKLKKPPNKIED